MPALPHEGPENAADHDGSDATATFCATLVDELVRAGITHAVVAPGSRSTPLALALVDDSRMVVHVHPDERSAAFAALGIGRSSDRPAVVLTTSGTAAVELHPAVVEADLDAVPLLACTADRPAELHGVGAAQTIDQQRLYGSSVRAFLDAGVPERGSRHTWRSLAARAVLSAVGPPPGPVQLNLPFREPLLGTPGPLPPGRPGGGPWHGVPGGVESSAADVDALAAALPGRRGVIVAGGGIDDPEGVHALADVLDWPVLADPRSGCRLPRSRTISHTDAVLRSPAARESLRPEVVLRLGSLPSSKVLATWLAGLDAWQVGVDAHGRRYDPDGVLSVLLTAPPGALCRAVGQEAGAGATAEGGAWLGRWSGADAEAASSIRAVLAAHPEPTEPAVARDVVAALPDGAELVVSSSMPIRDVEWYSSPRSGVRVHANRGANGIDGVVSTALGVAFTGVPTVALLGDLAFLHDSNGLLGVDDRIDLTLVVVDNDGGGIFSFLPQRGSVEADRFERLFGTPHGLDLVAVAGAYGVDADRVEAQHEVAPSVRAGVAGGGVRVIVVPTDRAANVSVHDEIHASVVAALA